MAVMGYPIRTGPGSPTSATFPAIAPGRCRPPPRYSHGPSTGMIWLAVLLLGLVAGTISGIVGFGASIMLMPALMLAVGPQEAVRIMAIAALMANLGRVLVWWRDIDWRANACYCATAVPAAALGARTLLLLDARVVEGVLGLMFFLMIPARRGLQSRGIRVEA